VPEYATFGDLKIDTSFVTALTSRTISTMGPSIKGKGPISRENIEKNLNKKK
jgi:hypothetical protein